MLLNYNDTYKAKDEIKIIDGTEFFKLESLGRVLRNRRMEFGLTQQEVADRAGVNIRQYQRLENDERSMSSVRLDIGLRICSVLQLDPHRFSLKQNPRRFSFKQNP